MTDRSALARGGPTGHTDDPEASAGRGAVRPRSNDMKSRVALALCLTALCLGAAACGSSAKVESTNVSVGQELQDLEEARDQGLITESEYQKQRQKIMNRR